MYTCSRINPPDGKGRFRIFLFPKFSVNSYTDPDTSGINFYNPKPA